MLTQDHILGHGEILDHAIAHPFLGDIRKHPLRDIAGSEVRDLFPLEMDLSARDLAQAGDTLRQLALPVAGDSRDPQDFSRGHLQAYAAQTWCAAVAPASDLL